MPSSPNDADRLIPQPTVPITFVTASTPAISERQRNLERARAQSHASLVGHDKRRKGLRRRLDKTKSSVAIHDGPAGLEAVIAAAVNGATPYPTLHSLPLRSIDHSNQTEERQQRRSLQLFVQNTAQAMMGWYDAEFWTVLMPQASAQYDCLRHGLVALSAYYEAMRLSTTAPGRNEKLRRYSLAQGQQAVLCLARESDELSVSVKLSAYVLIATLSCFFHPKASLQSIILQHRFKDQLSLSQGDYYSGLRSNERHFILQYLEPSLQRQRSKYAQLIDPQYALRNAPSSDFHLHDPVHVPDTFSSLSHARTVLEEVLRSKAFLAKESIFDFDTNSVRTDASIAAWRESLERFADSHTLSCDETLTLKILRISAQIWSISIATMYNEDEMVFDNFTTEYSELAEVFSEANVSHDGDLHTYKNFGIENTFTGLCAAPALRWCRSPDIRRSFIRSFRATDRQEGMDTARTWADVFEFTQNIEENGIYPPPLTCHDIPLENRRRIIRLAIHVDLKLIQVRYLRYPFRDTDVEDYWITHPGDTTILCWPEMNSNADPLPDAVYGQGFASFLKPGDDQEYWTVQNPKFYFNLPRL